MMCNPRLKIKDKGTEYRPIKDRHFWQVYFSLLLSIVPAATCLCLSHQEANGSVNPSYGIIPNKALEIASAMHECFYEDNPDLEAVANIIGLQILNRLRNFYCVIWDNKPAAAVKLQFRYKQCKRK